MAGIDLNLSGAIRRTNKGSVDFFYGGGDEAWASLSAAYAGIPSAIRNGKVFGVITAGVISEYWWSDATALANGDEVPYAQGGTTLTPDQVDAIDNANAPDAGNPFATMSDIVSGVVYQGTWNASTNTPTLTSSVGTQGYYYVVNVAGTTDLNGITDWEVGDWAIFNGTVYQKVDNTDNPTVWGSITGNILDQTDVGARKDVNGNTFVGGGNESNVLTGSVNNLFYLNADNNNLTNSANNIFNKGASNNTLLDSETYELGAGANACEIEGGSQVKIGDYCAAIKLLQTSNCVLGDRITNFDNTTYVGLGLLYCTVSSNLDFAAVDFTGATQLFGRANAWSINKVLGTNLIEVTFDTGLTTAKTGIYDTQSDTFIPYDGNYTPTLTPDGVIITAATLNRAKTQSNGEGFVSISLYIEATVDFSTANQGTIDYTLPFGTLDSSLGSLSFNLASAFPILPISGYERNGTIYVNCNDTTFIGSIGIFVTITAEVTVP